MNPTGLISCCRYKHPYIQGVYELALFHVPGTSILISKECTSWPYFMLQVQASLYPRSVRVGLISCSRYKHPYIQGVYELALFHVPGTSILISKECTSWPYFMFQVQASLYPRSVRVGLISCCRYKHPYIQGVYELAELITERFRFFPYHNPMIYHLSWSGYKFRRACRLVHTYSQEVIQNKQKDKLAENGVNMDDIHWLKHCAIILEVDTICDVCTHHIFKPSTKVRPW